MTYDTNIAEKEIEDTVEYDIFEIFIVMQCLMHEKENNFICTPKCYSQKYIPQRGHLDIMTINLPIISQLMRIEPRRAMKIWTNRTAKIGILMVIAHSKIISVHKFNDLVHSTAMHWISHNMQRS